MFVFRGKQERTNSSRGIDKNSLGKTKKLSEKNKTHPWNKVVSEARKVLNVKGYVKPTKGGPLYKKAMQLYTKNQKEVSLK